MWWDAALRLTSSPGLAGLLLVGSGMVQGREARRCGRTAETCVPGWAETLPTFGPRRTSAYER